MKFFVPDWDDRVDPGFHFPTDRPTLDRDPYRDDKYAHELMYPTQVYDGILVSLLSVLETKSGPKRERIERAGMRAYLRLPSDLELFGDCGAFGYVDRSAPSLPSGEPLLTDEVIAAYDRLKFAHGVSIDHLIVPQFADQRNVRYELTLRNAEEFITKHRRGTYRFTPIGAVQGWDPPSYADAARTLVGFGYDYLAIGGLARSNTKTIGKVVEAVVGAVPSHIRLHVFGVARPTLLPTFIGLGIASVDSATPLRQAWASGDENYHWLDGSYTAIRIPVAKVQRPTVSRSKKLKEQTSDGLLPVTLLGRADTPLEQLKEAEGIALRALRELDAAPRVTKQLLKTTIESVMAYDALLGERAYATNTVLRRALYERTLQDRPWKKCPCPICKEIGVEVIVFRGNNRNRRRAFHNLWVLRQQFVRLDACGKLMGSPNGVAAPYQKRLIGASR